MSSTAPIQVGDRVDCGEYRNAIVRRVGLGTIWAEVDTPRGIFPFNRPLHQFKRHVPEVPAVRIGDFMLLRNENTHRIAILDRRTGEAGDFEEARLESCLRRFWQREF